MEGLAAVVFFAVLCEWLSERFFGPWLKGYAMIAVSAFIGIGLCIAFRVDALALLGLADPMGAPWTGRVITGIAVGAGADAVHSLFFKGSSERTV